MIEQLNAPYLLSIYLFAMFGTFLGTGLGLLQSVKQRLDATWEIVNNEMTLPRWIYVCVGLSCLLISAGLAQFGIINLVSKGYGTMAWGFLVLFIIPVMTIGAYKVFFEKSRQKPLSN
jgi:uncharacterized membrane protein YkvI